MTPTEWLFWDKMLCFLSSLRIFMKIWVVFFLIGIKDGGKCEDICSGWKIKTFCSEGCFFWMFVYLSRNNSAETGQIHKTFSCCWIHVNAKTTTTKKQLDFSQSYFQTITEIRVKWYWLRWGEGGHHPCNNSIQGNGFTWELTLVPWSL